MQEHRTVTAHLQPDGLRVERFEGRQHVVVPATLMVAGIVVTPITSGRAEFVPPDALAAAPASWSGRPVTLGHPTSTAGDPRVLEAQRFGTVFGASFDGSRLTAELWLDPVAAERVGPEAEDIIARLRRGETTELSVGAFVELERRQGTAGGRRFEALWLRAFPDHVAALPAGSQGACTVSDGCGAGRLTAAQAAQATPTAEDVLAAIARTQYDRESRRIRRAAILDPPPEPYSEALARHDTMPDDPSPSLDIDGIPQPYTTALQRR